MLRSVVRLFAVLWVPLAACSVDRSPAPAATAAERVAEPANPSVALCNGGRFRCFSRTRVDDTGARVPLTAPGGYGPSELTAAYNVDTSTAVTATVAIIGAYGYAAIESDLAMYRSQFGLPPCTIASGCLTVLNQEGQTSPLPSAAPEGDDWPAENALDVDMVSAACPSCKIVVVEADDDVGDGLILANDTAVLAGASAVSNSWGAPEADGDVVPGLETHFNHPGVAIFASSGDDGYDDAGRGNGPAYPATSAYTIAVGGTTLRPANNARGWSETAWSDGGSSCSESVLKPMWQVSNACAFRMSADLSADGDVDTGVAIYNAADGGWMITGGTSVASPLVAGIFAQTGHTDATAELAYDTVGGFFDVTSGSNGSCSPNTILCTAGIGWDAPTGNGTPNGAVLAGAKIPVLTVSAPFDGEVLPPGYKVEVACTPGDSSTIKEVDIAIDGEQFGTFTAPPFTITAPTTLANNGHVIAITCTTSSIVQATATLHVTQSAACAHDSDCTIDGEICYGGACIAGAAVENGLGATCTGAGDCASQDCALDGSGGAVCAVACEAGAAACPGGFSCAAPADGSGDAQCLPTHGGGGCDASGGGPPIALFAVGLIVLVVRARPRWRA